MIGSKDTEKPWKTKTKTKQNKKFPGETRTKHSRALQTDTLIPNASSSYFKLVSLILVLPHRAQQGLRKPTSPQLSPQDFKLQWSSKLGFWHSYWFIQMKEILITAEMPPSTVGQATRRGCNPKSLSKDLDILNLKNRKEKPFSFGGDRWSWICHGSKLVLTSLS